MTSSQVCFLEVCSNSNLLVFEGNPDFFLAGQVMLDAGSPSATGFFPTIDFTDIYYSAMGMFLTWMSSRWPSSYPLSAALYHQGRGLPILRRRLAQGLYDNETCMMVLCTMQSEVISTYGLLESF